MDRAVQLLVQAVSEAIPGTVGAGISLLDTHGHGSSIGATNALVLLADDAQHGGPLKGVLVGRDNTNRACGILMERHRLSAEEQRVPFRGVRRHFGGAGRKED